MRKNILKNSAIILAALAATPVLAAEKKPNVVVIVAHESSDAGTPAEPTTRPAAPNREALAKTGVTFANAYSASPQVGPADEALLTGRYPQRTGLDIDPPATGKGSLQADASQHTLAQSLKAAGYATGAFGNDLTDAAIVGGAVQRGFDDVKLAADSSAEGATAFIQAHAADPFFAYVTLQGKGPALDSAVGQISGALHARALEENTLVILVQEKDHSNWTLRDSAVRSEWIVSRKGAIPAGKIVQQNVSGVDLAPTVLAAANITPAQDHPLDGASVLALAQNPDNGDADHPLFWRLGPQYAVQQGDWKLVKSVAGDASAHLFYLGNDPVEGLDLFKQQKQRAVALQAQWDAWNAGNQPPHGNDPRWNGQAGSSGDVASGEFGPYKTDDSVQGKKAPSVAGKNLEISAEIESDGSDGVIVTQGGAAQGYAIYIEGGKLSFAVRETGELTTVASSTPLGKGKFDIQATLKDGGKITLLVNGKPVATGEASGLLPQQPKAGLFVGKSGTGAVGEYATPGVFSGQVKNLRIKAS